MSKYNAPLSNDKVSRIVELLNLGRSHREIAAEVGCHQSTICDIRRRHGFPPRARLGVTELPTDSAATRALRRQVKELTIKAARATQRAEDHEIMVEMLRDTIERCAPVRVPPEPRSTKHSRSISMVGIWSDWHGGAVVEPSEVENLNAYNWEICQAGAWRVTQALPRWRDDESTHRVDELVLLILGDMINGMLHLEDLVYNEFEPPVQVVKVGELQAELIRYLAGRFNRVRVIALDTDNHSRRTKKPIAAGRGKWSDGYTVNQITRIKLEQLTNVRFDSVKEIKTVVDIQGKKFLCQHGNDIRGWNGLPFYGFRRALGNEAIIRMNRPTMRFDYMVTGHFHEPFWLPMHIGNGCLAGVTTYDHTCVRAAAPVQFGLLVHPKWGVFNATPFFRDAR